MNARNDINRIVKNAIALSDPQIYEAFIYECEDPDGFAEIETEIEELSNSLPDGVNILDLPCLFSGNSKSMIYGRATCSSTNGHMILNSKHNQIFHSEIEAEEKGFRPCAKCLPDRYKAWKI